MIDMVVFTTRYNQIRGSVIGKNRGGKCVEGGVVCGWVTNREVMTKFTT
jgi:hypothetical protein